MEKKLVNGNIPVLISAVVGVTAGFITGEWGIGVFGFLLTLLPIILVLNALYGSPESLREVRRRRSGGEGQLRFEMYGQPGEPYLSSFSVSRLSDSGLPY